MPVIPGTMLPQPPGGGVRYARSSMDGVRFLPRRTDGAQALAIGAGALEKAAGLWLQANIKAKEAKAAMDLDEIRVKAEAAYRDNMTALSQDPDGYETFGDRSQKNFLTLRQDCRELLDGLPAEHRRKAEQYLTGQAARWRDDTSHLQYQARVTALSGQAALSVQSQLNANDWNGARETVRVAVEQGVYTRAQGDALLADIGHRETWSVAVAEVKADPSRAAGYLEKNDDGSWKVDKPGLTPQDRERLARYGEELCRENAKELRDALTADPGNFDPQAVEYKRLDGQISDRDAEKLLAVHRACLDRESARSFDYLMQEGSAVDTLEKVEDMRAKVAADQSLSALERARRDAALAVHALRLKSKAEAEATKEQSEFYSEQKMRILYPGLFGDGAETVTYEDVMGWAEAKKLTYGQAYDLLHTGMSIRERREEAARKLQSRRAAVSATVAIEELEVPADPAERKRVFDELDGQLYGRFFADEPDTYKRLSDRLVERFSPDPRGWRKNEELRNGWEAYLDEQKEKGFFSVKTVEEPIYMYSGFGMMAGPREARTRDHAEESLLKWRGLMYDWLERNPKATEKELREYGDALRVRINAAHVGGELDELFAAAEASLRGTDIRRRREGGEGK